MLRSLSLPLSGALVLAGAAQCSKRFADVPPEMQNVRSAVAQRCGVDVEDFGLFGDESKGFRVRKEVECVGVGGEDCGWVFEADVRVDESSLSNSVNGLLRGFVHSDVGGSCYVESGSVGGFANEICDAIRVAIERVDEENLY